MSECHVPRLLRDKRIAIVGAGPAGLTLARLLQRQGATVAVFERDASAEARDQGGSLDLHEDSGQRALELTGLDAVFRAVARPEGQLSRILDARGRLQVELRAEDEARSRPEVDRTLLRHMLLASLDPGTVRWGHRLTGVEATTAGHWRLRFASGEPAEVDLLCGCDGLWSPVRRLRSDAAPAYTGVTFVQAFIDDIAERHPDLDRIAGPGSAMALGDNKAIMAQRNGDGRLRLYLALRVPEAWAETGGLPWSDAEAVRRRLLALFAGWAPDLLALIRCAAPCFTPWPLRVLRVGTPWRPAPGVTLLGDAAHVMPPFTGRGANLAMLDAVELAERLTSDRFPTLEAALADTEAAMRARMTPAIAEALASQDLMIAPDAPAGVAAMIRAHTGTDARIPGG